MREQAARIADVVRRLAKLKNPKSVEYSVGRAHDRPLEVHPPQRIAARRGDEETSGALFRGTHDRHGRHPHGGASRRQRRHARDAALHRDPQVLRRQGVDPSRAGGAVQGRPRGDEDRPRARRRARGVRAQRRDAGRDEVAARARRTGQGARALDRARRRRGVLPPRRRHGRRSRGGRGAHRRRRSSTRSKA